MVLFGILMIPNSGGGSTMKRNKSTLGLAAIFTAAIMLWITAIDISAQGRFVGQYSRDQVDEIIRRLEDSSDDFRDNFNDELNRSNLSNSQKNTYRRQVETFENATDRLRSNFDSRDDWWSSRSQVQNVVSNSRPLNITMNAIGFRRNIERQWNQLRNNVNTLADTYDLPGIGGGGWNGGGRGGGGGGGNAQRPPNWAVGTWYWLDGYGRTMSISNNGRITLYNNGRTSNGVYNRNANTDTIFVDGIRSTITRNGNNIRTYNTVTGENSDYSRNDTGGGGGGGGGNISSPPNWARGTWYWVEGPDRRMTIENDGRITLFNQGRTSFGTYYNNTITLDGITSMISRQGNQIRTVNQATGEYSTYRR